MTNRKRVAVATLIAAAIGACQGTPPESPPPEPVPEVSVTVAPIVRTTMHAYVEGWGRVEPEPATAGRPAASARVTSPVPGVITQVLGSEGQRIAQGATLFRLDSRVADLTVERADQAVRVAERRAARQRELGPGEATSAKAYEEAMAALALAQSEKNTAELDRRLLEVNAPIAGTLVKMNARPGDAVDPSTTLAELVDLERLVVRASIRSVDIAQVQRGQRMELSLSAGPGSPGGASPAPALTATVDYIAPLVDSATDTVLVRAQVPATAAIRPAIRPGQFASVRIGVGERTDRLAVPVESIVSGVSGSEVAIVRGDVAIRTPVTTGLREGGLVEVEGDGIREGDSVVVEGAYGLPETTKIKIVGR